MASTEQTPYEPGPLVPQGAAYFPVTDAGVTRNYAFVLVPGFTLLAFSSAVEPLRIANQLSQRPLYRWDVQSETGGPVASSSGITVGTEPIPEAFNRDTRVFVCSGNPPSAAGTPPIVAVLQRHHRFGGIVGGICTGAVALARAGLLKDRRFTLHWENQPGFIETFPQFTPTENRFETESRVMTCGGGAASTDMMLSVIASDYGNDLATMVSEMCLRTVMAGVAPEQRSSIAAVMELRNPLLASLIKTMNDHLDDPILLRDLARTAGYSRRHLERLFVTSLGKTPGEFYRDLRLDRGRNLLITTDLTLLDISAACGFASVAHFSKCFKDRFGMPPTKLKTDIKASGIAGTRTPTTGRRLPGQFR
jgi:AraC family transcriptional regulator, carnitine catabolism transcriptional activator